MARQSPVYTRPYNAAFLATRKDGWVTISHTTWKTLHLRLRQTPGLLLFRTRHMLSPSTNRIIR